MTTILVVEPTDEEPAVREVLGSVADSGETVHFLRLPTVRGLDQVIQNANSTVPYEVEYTVSRLPEGYDASDLVEFAIEHDADQICLRISGRTPTGKVRIDDQTQSILLHKRISGTVAVGETVITLEELEYEA
jgi:hypothetical protein